MEVYEKMLGLSRVPGEEGDLPGQGAGIRKLGALAQAEDPAGYPESPVTTCCLRPLAPPRPVPRPGPAALRPACAGVSGVTRFPAACLPGPYPRLQTGLPDPRPGFGLVPASSIRTDGPAFSILQSGKEYNFLSATGSLTVSPQTH